MLDNKNKRFLESHFMKYEILDIKNFKFLGSPFKKTKC